MPDSNVSGLCSRQTKWGQCLQRTDHESGLCSAHFQWETRGKTPDAYYEEKVVRGLVEPTWDWMTEHEAHALLNGRYRGDGRRLDQWVSADPLMIDEDAL